MVGGAVVPGSAQPAVIAQANPAYANAGTRQQAGSRQVSSSNAGKSLYTPDEVRKDLLKLYEFGKESIARSIYGGTDDFFAKVYGSENPYNGTSYRDVLIKEWNNRMYAEHPKEWGIMPGEKGAWKKFEELRRKDKNGPYTSEQVRNVMEPLSRGLRWLEAHSAVLSALQDLYSECGGGIMGKYEKNVLTKEAVFGKGSKAYEKARDDITRQRDNELDEMNAAFRTALGRLRVLAQDKEDIGKNPEGRGEYDIGSAALVLQPIYDFLESRITASKAFDAAYGNKLLEITKEAYEKLRTGMRDGRFVNEVDEAQASLELGGILAGAARRLAEIETNPDTDGETKRLEANIVLTRTIDAVEALIRDADVIRFSLADMPGEAELVREVDLERAIVGSVKLWTGKNTAVKVLFTYAEPGEDGARKVDVIIYAGKNEESRQVTLTAEQFNALYDLARYAALRKGGPDVVILRELPKEGEATRNAYMLLRAEMLGLFGTQNAAKSK